MSSDKFDGRISISEYEVTSMMVGYIENFNGRISISGYEVTSMMVGYIENFTRYTHC